MKSKIVRRIMSTILVGTFLVGMTACGSQGVQTNESTSNSSIATSESEGSSQPVEQVTEPEELTYPLADAPELSIFTSQPVVNAVYSDYTQSPYHIGLAENTGVDMEWIYPAAGADAGETYNLLLTDNELPNIIAHGVSVADAQLLAEEGMIYDLTEYLPTYAPDYWAFLNENENLLKDTKSDDGHIYGVRCYLESDFNRTYMGPSIRQDWLDECGLKAPVTLEDWENVLVAFKDKYGAKLGWSTWRISAGIASGKGAHASMGAEWYVDNGVVKLGNAEESWKETLEVMHKWYDMGLIDQDNFTMNQDALRTKILNNEIGVAFGPMSQLTAWINDAEKESTGAEWVGLSYPRMAADAATTLIQTQTQTVNYVAMITTQSTEAELIAALQWLNYGFTEEGRMYINFGNENETYTLDADGNVHWTELVAADPDGIASAVTKYTGASGTPMATIQASRMVQIKNNEKASEAVFTWIDNTDIDKYTLPTLALTTDESIVYNDKFTPLSAYVSEMATKFVIGEESLDKFDDFVKTLNEMGLEECQKIQQVAYDRYMSR